MDKSEALSILEQSKPSCSIRYSIASAIGEDKGSIVWNRAAEILAEITHIFCDNDIYAYGSLKGITFERSQTLGTGGSKCDFHLYKTK